MAEIRIESKPTLVFGRHLYLVLVTDDGQEFVIRGGPERDEFRNYGDIVTVADVPLMLSEDARAISERAERGSTVLDLGGRDPLAVWEVMAQSARQAGASEADYDLLKQNSNSVVASAMHAVGLNIEDYTPIAIGGFGRSRGVEAGRDNRLLDDYARDYAGSDAVAGDVLYGGALDDRFEGRGGDDTIDGGRGADVAVFSAAFAEFDIVDLAGGQVSVSYPGGTLGTDTLISIETLSFADGNYDVASRQFMPFEAPGDEAPSISIAVAGAPFRPVVEQRSTVTGAEIASAEGSVANGPMILVSTMDTPDTTMIGSSSVWDRMQARLTKDTVDTVEVTRDGFAVLDGDDGLWGVQRGLVDGDEALTFALTDGFSASAARVELGAVTGDGDVLAEAYLDGIVVGQVSGSDGGIELGGFGAIDAVRLRPDGDAAFTVRGVDFLDPYEDLLLA